MKRFFLLLLKIYQKFFTLLSYGSCRYYPSCSEYAKWQILHNSILKAIWFSTLRILRCNQLFAGGIDYPVVKKSFVGVTCFQKLNDSANILFWFVPKDAKHFYIVKAFSDLPSQRVLS